MLQIIDSVLRSFDPTFYAIKYCRDNSAPKSAICGDDKIRL